MDPSRQSINDFKWNQKGETVIFTSLYCSTVERKMFSNEQEGLSSLILKETNHDINVKKKVIRETKKWKKINMVMEIIWNYERSRMLDLSLK